MFYNFIFIVWVGLSLACGGASYARGRGFIVAFFLSLIISPFITLILIFSSMDLVKEENDERRHRELIKLIKSINSSHKNNP